MISETIEYEWKFNPKKEESESSAFPENGEEFRWKLKCSCNHVYPINYIYLNLFLNAVKIPVGHVEISGLFQIFPSDLEGSFQIAIKSFKTINFVGITLLADERVPYEMNILSKTGNIPFRVKISIMAKCSIVDSSLASSAVPRESLSAQQLLASLLEDTEFCDLTIKAGKEELHAHKNILAASSPVFHKYLTTDMREKNNSCIEIKDFEMNIVQLMINFIYKKKIDISDYRYALDLLKISDIYNIQNLKEFCVTYLKDVLKEDNALQICLAADMNNAEELKKHAMEYFVENPANYTFNDYMDIMTTRKELMAELMLKLTEKMKNN